MLKKKESPARVDQSEQTVFFCGRSILKRQDLKQL